MREILGKCKKGDRRRRQTAITGRENRIRKERGEMGRREEGRKEKGRENGSKRRAKWA